MNVSPWLCMLEYSFPPAHHALWCKVHSQDMTVFFYTHKKHAYTVQQILLSVPIMIAYQCQRRNTCQKLCTVLSIKIIHILDVSLLCVMSVHLLGSSVTSIFFAFSKIQASMCLPFPMLSVFFHSSFDDEPQSVYFSKLWSLWINFLFCCIQADLDENCKCPWKLLNGCHFSSKDKTLCFITGDVSFCCLCVSLFKL